MTDVRLPFGRHKGEKLEDVPSDYLEWALENCDLRPALQAEMEAQLALRRGEGVQRQKGRNG